MSTQFTDTAPELQELDVPMPWQVLDRLGRTSLDAAVQAYKSGESARNVAASLGISKSALLQVLRDRGVQVRPHTLLSDADVLEAGRLYESGLLLREVADKFDVSVECVRKRLLAIGVVMRPGVGGRAGGSRRR